VTEQGHIFILLVAHLAMTGLPMVAATLLAARAGVRRIPVLLAVGLAASGVIAMLTFWAYFADPTIGETLSFFVLFGSLLATIWVLYERRLDRELLRGLATPLALWVLGSAFLVFLGFVHGGDDNPLQTASVRFNAANLPSDNDIPHFFTEWFYAHGHNGTPPIFQPDWHFSDRPPLQVGYMLGQRPILWDAKLLDYQLIGVVLQQLWIVGLWALLVAARLGRVTRALAILAVLTSDVAIVNGFFVWPKMLPAAMILAAAALAMTVEWSEVRTSLWGAALVAALLGVAMLGHGSSLFGVIPIAIIALRHGPPSWRWIGVAAAVGLVLLAPWSYYQRHGDPPGNRLNKWMLAGVMDVDPRSTRETIFDSYGEAGFGGALHNKAENFVTMAGGGPAWQNVEHAWNAVTDGHPGDALREIRTMLFLYFVPSLGLLAFALVAMAFARKPGRKRAEEWRFALNCLFVVAVGALFWGLILFGNWPSRTVLHVGSFVLPILAFCACVVGLRAVFPRFAIYYVAISSVLMLAVYVPMLEPGGSYSATGFLLSAASLACFGLVAVGAGGPAGALGRIRPLTVRLRPSRSEV